MYITHILVVISTTVFLHFFGSANGQSINTPCSTSMINNFSPCMNYITGSSSNGTSPTTECCNSLSMVIAASIDCACLIITANVPLPTSAAINKALVISLPSFCNSPGVPIQCKASGTPLPPPGPILFAPPPPPSVIAPSGPEGEPQVAPEIASLPPATSPVDVVEASSKSSMGVFRTVVSPSSSSPSWTISCPTLMLMYLGILIVLKLY